MKQAQRFLAILAGDEPVTFQTFNDGKTQNGKLARILQGRLKDHEDTLNTLNSQGAGVFVMVNHGDGQGRKTINVTGVRALFVDLDGAPLEPVTDCAIEPHMVIESSRDRYHAYWLVSDCALDQFTKLQAALAIKFNSDPKVKDLPRVMRLPGYWHQKDTAFLTSIRQENPAPPYPVADLIDLLGLNTQPVANKSKFDRENALNGFAQGGRDAGLFRYACSLRVSGLKKEEVRLLVHEAATQCNPPMSVTDADNCVESAWRYDSSRSEKMTDVGNARRLVSKYGKDIRYVFGFKKWLVWDGGRWLFDEDGEIMRRTKDTVTDIYNEAKSASEAGDKKISEKFEAHAKNSQSLPRIKAAIELAQSEPGIPVSTNQLDNNNYILGVSNGVINLKTGALREPRREDLITKCATVAYDPNASAPIFMSFLKRIMNGNSAMISFIQRAVGYSLTGATDEQCLFFLHGSGSNGKSTLLNVIRELLGDYALQCPAETLMVKQGGGSIPNDIARLRGARMVATSETEEGRRFAEVMIKQLTGNDTIAARFLFGEYFEFVPNFKIWLAANHKPVIRGDDYAIWRRIRLIPFAVTISPEEKDGKLPEKLKAEYPGILAWAVEGCLEWQRLGLTPPQEVRAATEEYKSEMDLIGKWIEECCNDIPHVSATAKALYTNYKSWVEDNGGYPLSSTKFGLKLRDRGYTKGKSSTTIYHGIGLREHSVSRDSWEGWEGSLRSPPHFDDTYRAAEDPEKASQLSQLSQLSSSIYIAATRGE